MQISSIVCLTISKVVVKSQIVFLKGCAHEEVSPGSLPGMEIFQGAYWRLDVVYRRMVSWFLAAVRLVQTTQESEHVMVLFIVLCVIVLVIGAFLWWGDNEDLGTVLMSIAGLALLIAIPWAWINHEEKKVDDRIQQCLYAGGTP